MHPSSFPSQRASPQHSTSSFPPPAQTRYQQPHAQPHDSFQVSQQYTRNQPGRSSSSSAGRRSVWDDPVEDELRAMLADDDVVDGGDAKEWQVGGLAQDFSSPSPSPSTTFNVDATATFAQQSSHHGLPPSNQQQARDLSSYYSQSASVHRAPPPPQPSFAPAVTAQANRATQGPAQQRQGAQGGGGMGAGLIRPMPVRPAPAQAPQRSSGHVVKLSYPSTTHSELPVGSISQSSHPGQSQQGFAQLEEVDEDEEDYWGGEAEGDGFENALVGLEAGVVPTGPVVSTSRSQGKPTSAFQALVGRPPRSQPPFRSQPYPSRPQARHANLPSQPRFSQATQNRSAMQRAAQSGAISQTHSQGRAHQQRSQPVREVQCLEDLDAFAAPRQDAEGKAGEVRKKGLKLRMVSELPDMLRSLWRFGVFNAVQSACFDTVYHSDASVVISAPTGAGKTVLFELAILRLFTNCPDGEAKVLYMAPTKSLCSERVLDWKRKFEIGLGWGVQELTGDSSNEAGTAAWRDVAKARIVVTTPEKWDAMTRRWHSHGETLGSLRLFCVDEVHTVGADVRGAVLEVVVSRMKILGTETRFIAVSATVPNIEDVAEWLGSNSPVDKGPDGKRSKAEVFQFGEEFRPCKLQKLVFGYPKKGDNDFMFVNVLNTKLYDLIKQHSSGKPVLIFCSTRKGCTQAADALVKEYKQALSTSSSAYRQLSNLAWPKPPRSSYSTSDKHLAALIENGVAVHHAGMEFNDRRLVEKLFIEGGVSVVCSTSTLAVGVNLPARMVIIRGTKAFVDGQMKEYSELDVQQMIGRAGRPQFDKLGVACIMTDKESQWRYEDLNKLESSYVPSTRPKTESAGRLIFGCFSLHKSLTEHVNSEITLRSMFTSSFYCYTSPCGIHVLFLLEAITGVPTALHWLRSTFLFIRIAKNAPYYAIANGASNPDERLEEICVQAINELVNSGVVEKEGEELAPNNYGDIMSKFYISHKTFLSLKNLPKKSSMRTLLETLVKADEFAGFRWRAGEKTVMIIIQLVLECISSTELKNDNINPLLESRSIFSSALRIAKTMVEVAIEREDGAIRTMLELLRSLRGYCWDNSTFVLRQLEGIGEKSYKVLVDSDIRTFDDIRQAEPERLEIILCRKPPFGRKLITQAKQLPQFEVNFLDSSENVLAEGVQLDVQVEVKLKETKPPSVTKKGSMKLWVSIAATTSDGVFVDFRRMRLDQLQGNPRQFELTVTLIKPSQRLVVSAACESFAGSEAKSSYKASTRSSDFPIPSPSAVSEEEDDINEPKPLERPKKAITAQRELLAVQKTAGDQFTAAKLAPSRQPPNVDEEEDEEDPYWEPKVLANGKYECGHTCADKAKCKHLCCREGRDKPPRRKPKSAVAGNAKAGKKPKTMMTLDKAFAITSDAQSKPWRLGPKASSGVTLFKGAGRTITTVRDSDAGVDGVDAGALPSLDRVVSTAERKPIRRTFSASSRLFSLSPSPPKPSYLDIDNSDPGDEAGGQNPLFSNPSLPSASLPEAPRPSFKRVRSSIAKENTTLSSVTTPHKRRRVSLREFASSSSVDLDAEPARKPASSSAKLSTPPLQLEKATSPRKEPLFRHDPFDSPVSSSPPPSMLSALNYPGTPSPPERTDAPARQEPSSEPMEQELGFDDAGDGDQASIAQSGENMLAGDEDDEFDAWLKENVVIV
ncbi:hypothetical protein JCM11641_000215 [Rhodosporidiobolus odoratus]